MSRPIALTGTEVSWLKILLKNVEQISSLDVPFAAKADRPVIVGAEVRGHLRDCMANLDELRSQLG